ncbi:hypothetical protein OE88DRAFT_1447352 [Heliocybe sulcata]|uniref:DUF6534 domain-containing protein n=1 Tax=Heliocybe sulcata TaxID=5364 RepID=A0A5C3N365_9AGAM|nr:hypothetical protein OE88DRAFT_1447352 [Heliocybe sulcata]
MICALWVLDVVHLAICSRLGQVALTSTSDLIVRSTFTHKIWLLSGRNMSLGAIAMAASLLPFSFGIAFSRKAAEAKYFTELPNLSWLLYSCLSVTVVADVVVATALCLLLWRQRTGFRKTDSLIAAIMRYSVETSLLTCTCAVACLVTVGTSLSSF